MTVLSMKGQKMISYIPHKGQVIKKPCANN